MNDSDWSLVAVSAAGEEFQRCMKSAEALTAQGLSVIASVYLDYAIRDVIRKSAAGPEHVSLRCSYCGGLLTLTCRLSTPSWAASGPTEKTSWPGPKS